MAVLVVERCGRLVVAPGGRLSGQIANDDDDDDDDDDDHPADEGWSEDAGGSDGGARAGP